MQEQLHQLVDVLRKDTIVTKDLDEIAKNISAIVIDAFSDELLEKGLLVVKAICDFSAELEKDFDDDSL